MPETSFVSPRSENRVERHVIPAPVALLGGAKHARKLDPAFSRARLSLVLLTDVALNAHGVRVRKT
jgi:hypothetical protein